MTDALSRLRAKQKNRATVPPRTDELTGQLQKTEETIAPSPTPESPTISPQAGGDALAELKRKLEQLPQTKRHSAIVLEVGIDAALTDFCRDKGITLELFLEAAWIHLSTQPTLLDNLVEDARMRRAKRVEAGNLRRLIKQMEKAQG